MFETELLAGVLRGNIDVVTMTLSRGADIYAVDQEGEIPLHIAS